MAVRRTTNAMGTIKTVDSLVTWYKRELDKENQYYINTNTIITVEQLVTGRVSKSVIEWLKLDQP